MCTMVGIVIYEQNKLSGCWSHIRLYTCTAVQYRSLAFILHIQSNLSGYISSLLNHERYCFDTLWSITLCAISSHPTPIRPSNRVSAVPPPPILFHSPWLSVSVTFNVFSSRHHLGLGNHCLSSICGRAIICGRDCLVAVALFIQYIYFIPFCFIQFFVSLFR